MAKRLLSNILLAILSPVLILGAAEWGIRTFYSHRLNTYFDDQAQLVLGKPAAPKAANEYRIFIFGDSAAYGFPVADRYSIAAWLRKSFPYLIPGKKITVLNTAWPGKSSHQMARGARAVLKYKPDLFIVYSGNNEAVIDNRLYVDKPIYRLGLYLEYESAFYRLLLIRLDKLRRKIVYGHSGYPEKQYRNEVIASRVYKSADISLNDYARVLSAYEENIQSIIYTAKSHGIDVLLLTLPANLRNIPPGRSIHHQMLSTQQLQSWEKAFVKAQALQKTGDYAAAAAAYQEGAAIDPTYSELQFQWAVCLDKTGDYPAAREAYLRAKDFDAAPGRAKSELNEAVRRLAAENGLMLYDLEHAFAKLSGHGIISRELMYDNVHPTVQAQQIISDGIAKVLWENSAIEPMDKWQWPAFEAARLHDKDWQIAGEMNAYHAILTGLNLWEQKRFQDAASDLQEATRLMPAFIESYAFLADAYYRLGNKEKAAASFRSIKQKDPKLLDFLCRKYPDIGESYLKVNA